MVPSLNFSRKAPICYLDEKHLTHNSVHDRGAVTGGDKEVLLDNSV